MNYKGLRPLLFLVLIMKRYYLLIVLLAYSSLSFSASCPVGDKPTLTWPLGTSKVYSACVNGCLAVEGFGGTNTWVCNESLGYCTGYYETNGQPCEPEDGGDGSCPDNNCNDGSDRPHFEYSDIKFKPLTPPPSVITEKNFGLAQALKFNSDVNVNQTQHLRVEIRDQTERLNNQSRILVNNVTEQTNATKAAARNTADLSAGISRLNDTAFTHSQQALRSHIQDKEFYEYLNSVLGKSSDMSTNPVSLFDALGHLWSNSNSQGSTLHSINNNTSSMGYALDNLYNIDANLSYTNRLLEGLSGGSGNGNSVDLQPVIDSISKVNNNLDALANLDTSDVSVCNGGECPKGFYTSKYENGFSGVFDDNFDALKNSVIDGVTEVFGSIDLSNAVAPSFCLIIGSFGSFCFTDYINLDWIFTFVRAAFMFTTIFYSRKLIIGG